MKLQVGLPHHRRPVESPVRPWSRQRNARLTFAAMDALLHGGQRTRGIAPEQRADAPLVSIVTVVFNGAATLERTIQSVLAQSYPNIEYIIVDGGSTDGTLEIIRRYEDRLSYWESARDKGIYDGMNKGVALCTGEWVGLINADDWYAPHSVERAMGAVRGKSGINIVHGDIWLEYPNGHSKVKRARLNGFLLKYWEMVLNHPSFFVRRSYYATHPFDITIKVSGDHKWTVDAWMETPRQFLYLAEPLAHFTAGGASMRVPLGRMLREGRLVSRAIGHGPFGVALSQLVRLALYVPQGLKLIFNQHVSPLAGKQQ
ncbi:MAG: glycosyltransferase [Flavobacteriales bacterium]|jgi:glycosyltransferase involved in cell wall biosynthesis|nr:glycosyltransferase [Flavobacteriales bacterium]